MKIEIVIKRTGERTVYVDGQDIEVYDNRLSRLYTGGMESHNGGVFCQRGNKTVEFEYGLRTIQLRIEGTDLADIDNAEQYLEEVEKRINEVREKINGYKEYKSFAENDLRYVEE